MPCVPFISPELLASRNALSLPTHPTSQSGRAMCLAIQCVVFNHFANIGLTFVIR